MGLFDFLFGSRPASNVQTLGDRVWMTQQAKLGGIRKALESRTAAVLLVGHFQDTIQQLAALAAECQDDEPIVVSLAEARSRDLLAPLHLEATAKGAAPVAVDVIVAERHPLREMDENLVRLLEELPCRCRLVHHLSLEDPLMKQFAGEWVANLLAKLGMRDEAIESKMVSRRIQDAQRKIQAEVFGSAKANSAAEWLEKNLPNTSRT